MAEPDGGLCCRARMQSRGSPCENSCGKIAIVTKMTTSTAAVQKILLRRRSFHASLARLRGLSRRSRRRLTPGWVLGASDVVTASRSLITDPRVQGGVEQVNQQVDNQEDDHQYADEAHHERAVFGPDPAEQ